MSTAFVNPEEYLVRATASDYGVDPDTAARIAHTESGFDQNAVSPKGARGVMQLMPGTAQDLGVDPGDLAQNIDGGVRYYKQLLDRFGGDERKAAAAYNAGPGRVESGKPLPDETKAYVDKVAPITTNFADPEDFLKQGATSDQPASNFADPEAFLKQPDAPQPAVPVSQPASSVPGMGRLGGSAPPIAGSPIPAALQSPVVSAPAAPAPLAPGAVQVGSPQIQSEEPLQKPVGPAFVTPYHADVSKMPVRSQDPGLDVWGENVANAIRQGKIGDAVKEVMKTPVDMEAVDQQLSNFLVGPFAVQKGVIESAIAAGTSPGNIVLAGGVGAAGEIAEAVSNPYVRATWETANTALAAAFAGNAAVGAYQNGKQAWDALNKGDFESAAKDLGFGTVDGLFAYLGARGAIAGGMDIKQGIQEGIQLGKFRAKLQDELYRREAERRAAERAAVPQPLGLPAPAEPVGEGVPPEAGPTPDTSAAATPLEKATASARAGVEALSREPEGGTDVHSGDQGVPQSGEVPPSGGVSEGAPVASERAEPVRGLPEQGGGTPSQTAPEPAAGDQRGDSGGSTSGQNTEDIVTGTLDPKLTEKGHQEAGQLGDNTSNTRVFVAGPKTRTLETAGHLAEIAGPDAHVIESPAMGPWNLGSFQGKPQGQVDDQINEFIAKKPGEAVPGGESFDAYKARPIGEIQAQAKDWRPGQRVVNVTHSIGVQTIDAWLKNGAPADQSIDTQAMLGRAKVEPGALLRIDPRTMSAEFVKNTKQDGIYVTRHAETPLDNIGENGQPAAEQKFADPEEFLAKSLALPVSSGAQPAGSSSGGRVPLQVHQGDMTRAEYADLKTRLREDHGDLGFDSTKEAVDAIATHQDWAQRWDVHDPEVVRLGNKLAGWPQQLESPTAQETRTAIPLTGQSEGVQSDRGVEKRALLESRRPSHPFGLGESTVVRVPGEDRSFNARYGVREAKDVVASHNAFTFEENPNYQHKNDRNYSDPRNAERILKQTGEFDPAYLITDSPDATNGPPVIDRNGNVLGGNSRTMTLNRVYQSRPEAAQAYRALLMKKAAYFGLDPDLISGMKHPVLVRELSDEISPEGAKAAITSLNRTGTASLTGAERAISDSARLSPETLGFLANAIEAQGENGTLAQALDGKTGVEIVNRLIDDDVIPVQEKPTYIDARGLVTAQGKDRISKLMLGRLFRDSDQLDNSPAALRNKLERVVAPLSRVAGKEGWDLTSDVRSAIDMLEHARAAGVKNLDDLVRQEGMFGKQEYSQQAVTLAKAIQSDGPVSLARAFNRYAADAKGPTMFGEVSPAEAFADAFEGGGDTPLYAALIPKLGATSRTEPYVAGASTRFHALRTELKPIELDGRESRFSDAYVTNHSGVELIGRAAGKPVDSMQANVGTHIGWKHAMALAKNLRTVVGRAGMVGNAVPKPVSNLIDALERSYATRKSLALITDHQDFERYHETALAEELSHGVQAAGTGNLLEHISSDQALDRFYSSPLAIRTGRRLGSEYGIPALSQGAAVEIGVRLMRPGGVGELGLSSQEARLLAAHYVRVLRGEYGRTAPRDVAEEVFNNLRPLRGATGGSAEEPRALPDGPGSEGRSGPAGGTGPDLSSYRPPIQGDQGPGRNRDARNSAEETSLFEPGEAERVARESAADREKLTGERLTAQFKAPISREEQLQKLRPAEAPPQTNFFEETPEKQQFSLFGSERGGVSPDLLTLGANKFVQEDVVPAAKRVASDLVGARDDIRRVVAPQLRGSAAEYTGLNLRYRMAQFARRFDQGEQRLREARKFFSKRSPEDNYRFIDNVERGLGRGRKPGDAELEPIARMFSKMLDQRRTEVQALGEGALKGFYQYYFPHIFERPEAADKFIQTFFSGKRSMEGPKSFLQHRDFPTFQEAVEAGLKPVSDNPVDLVMIKAREMDRYLLAHAVLRDLAEKGVAKRVSGLGPDARQAELISGAPIRPEWAVEKREDLPPGFMSIRDPVGGGKWYAEEGAADVLNNFLSPGLRGRSGLFRTLLGVNNTMNQANLGLSAFHLRAVTISSMASRMGLGMVKAMQGHPVDAAWHMATSPAAPFIDYLKGSKVLREWFKPGSEGAPVTAMTDSLMKGGGRARMDAFYQNNIAEKMRAAFRSGNFVGGVIRSPFAAIEATSKPLMEFLVPRMKLGAFSDMAQHEMERLGPGASVEGVQRAMSDAWDHVENRLGQMTYDNRFWNRTFKDVAMLAVRSVGWNLGDFLETKSAIGAVKQAASLKKPTDLHGLGFVMGYTVVAAIMGAIMQYLHTGHGPDSLEDYFFPKREDGRRVVSAPYVKDAYQFAKDPARTIENKASPLITSVMQMVHNRDYYDRPIVQSEAPWYMQLQQEAEFIGRQFLPFTLQQEFGNQPKKKSLPGGDTKEHKGENFLGITPAPGALQPGYKPRHQPSK